MMQRKQKKKHQGALSKDATSFSPTYFEAKAMYRTEKGYLRILRPFRTKMPRERGVAGTPRSV